MTNHFLIKKGFDIPIQGSAAAQAVETPCIGTYAVKPTDFVGLVPKLLVAEGDTVHQGQALFIDKNDPRIRFASPVAGTVKSIVRGDKRALLAVVVERDNNAPQTTNNDWQAPQSCEELKDALLEHGIWPLLRQRPFGIVARPDIMPKAIFISAFDSAPLGVDYDYAMKGREQELVAGIQALTLLTDGMVHLSFRPQQRLLRVLESHLSALRTKVGLHTVSGPHPAGNVGTQIAHIDPINNGDTVWTIELQGLATLGHFMLTGAYLPKKVVAVAGPTIKAPQYYKMLSGAEVRSIVDGQVTNPDYPHAPQGDLAERYRIISGNVLAGTNITANGYLGYYDSLLSLLPEGDYYDFMGWLMPGLKKHSFSQTFLSGFFKGPLAIANEYLPTKFDTNMHGSVRPLVFSGNFEKVFPFDIYPLQLLKACIIGDIDLMEQLGIYEVEPEDFALCEYIDPSKTDIQTIVREALEKIRKETIG